MLPSDWSLCCVSDARRRSICSTGEVDAGVQIAGHVQTNYGRTGTLHVPTGEPSSGTTWPLYRAIMWIQDGATHTF